MKQRRKTPFHSGFGVQEGIDNFDQKRVFGDRIGEITERLTVPAGDKGQPVRDIFNFDIHRSRVQQIKPSPREHPLPCAWLFHFIWIAHAAGVAINHG